MIVIFTFALLVLLAIGVPVAFSLGASGLLGMVLFMPGDGALEQIPILAYKALDDFVLCAVPLYILMSAILLKGKVGEDLFDLSGCGICPAALALRRLSPAASLPRLQVPVWPARSQSEPLPFRKC